MVFSCYVCQSLLPISSLPTEVVQETPNGVAKHIAPILMNGFQHFFQISLKNVYYIYQSYIKILKIAKNKNLKEQN